VVGAKNILARGHRVAACGEAVSRCVSSANLEEAGNPPKRLYVRQLMHSAVGIPAFRRLQAGEDVKIVSIHCRGTCE